MKKTILRLAPALLALALLLCGCSLEDLVAAPEPADPPVALEEVPAFDGSPYVAIDGNQPSFTQEEITTEAFETYSPLDALGRCGTAFACVGQELMPTEDRESISSVHPSGWVQNEYDFVDGQAHYNRCHLIGFQLTGENANDRNLITGTRYMNVEGMLPFENLVADYIHETGNHVMYRVTPVFAGADLVASGVVMEALSVEDDGEGVCFHVYAYNVQPGVEIAYSTGNNWESQETGESSAVSSLVDGSHILNTNSRKFHRPGCPSVQDIRPENREEYHGSREELLNEGYQPCGGCQP